MTPPRWNNRIRPQMCNQDIIVREPAQADDAIIDDQAITQMVLDLKRDRNAVILAHNYQPPEIQDVADFAGDSLGLSREAARTSADIIVFCGVHFMAETAKILAPEKTVLLPELRAGCPMANMAEAADVREMRKMHPDAMVVSYVNTTAAVKAESDYCCTSANAVHVCEAVDADEIIFVPDRNLAAYVASRVNKRIIPWDGYCPTHENITPTLILQAKNDHPGAEVIAHPECPPAALELADHIRSTSGMLDAVQNSPAKEFIIATEVGMLYPLSIAAPDRKFYSLAEPPLCPTMKLITLSKIVWSLETVEPRIEVPEEIRIRALRSVERMLALG